MGNVSPKLWILKMLAKPTTRASIFCKRLYHLKCFNCKKHLISYFSTQSLPQQSRSLAKTQNYKTFIVRCNSQITKYGRNGSIGESESINNRMPIKSAFSWIALLTDYARNGEIIKARELFDKMPHRITASYNAMISAYIRNNCMIDEAFELFARIPEYNARSYSTMIAGFVKAGMLGKAEKLYYETPVKLRDPACSNALISGYLKFGYLEEAFRVFCGMLDRDVVSWSAMVDGYCKMGRIVDARRLFDTTPDRNVVTWTAMINGYMKSEDFEEGFKLFLEMRREQRVESNSTTFSVMFDACRSFAGYEEGIQMHGLVARMGFDYDIFLGNSIIAMYCRFGCIGAASKIFHMMRETDVVSWNSLIAGYVQCTEIEEAFKLFERMPKKDVTSWTTIISGFFKKGLSDKAIQLFRMMPEKDSFAWTALISGFVNNEEYEEAFRWFIEMLQREVRLGPLTISSVLSASAGLASLNQGLQIHALVVKMCMEFDLSIQNSLVSMYSKCGDLVNACEIFTGIRSPNIISYNSMITGFSQNGFGKEALILFSKMQKEGIKPNEVTFLGVLSACVHVGLVEEGWKYFELMKPIYNIEPGPNHYACMVDLLGRAGLLDEAMELIDSMPFEPHAGVWGALLGTSRTHLRLDFARIAAEQLIELQPDNGTPYVVLSNLCSLSGNTKDGNQIRMAKKSKGVRKSPGCSWIIVKDKVNLFLAADRSHMDLEEIKATLRFIATEMKHMHCY